MRGTSSMAKAVIFLSIMPLTIGSFWLGYKKEKQVEPSLKSPTSVCRGRVL